MYFPNRETCPACGKVAHGVHECNQVHIVDHQRARGGRDERARIVAIIDARLMAIEPNDADASDESHGRVMELHHLRRLIVSGDTDRG
jgi:uncharacterized OB-fold protein